MLEHIEITNVSVSKATKKVNPSKSQGPDMIHLKLIKESQAALDGSSRAACDSLMSFGSLTSIFPKSLEEGKIPKIWKKSQCNGNIQEWRKIKSK